MKDKLIIFDLDGTLYTRKNYIFQAVRFKVINRIAEIYSSSFKEAGKMYWSLGNQYPNPYKGLASLGISPKEYHVIFDSINVEKYISYDYKLKQFLDKVNCVKRIVTFSPQKYSSRVLSALGVENCFDEVINIDKKYNYEKSNYYESLKIVDNNVLKEIYVVGDDYKNDILPGIRLGFKGFLVTENKIDGVTCRKKVVNFVFD